MTKSEEFLHDLAAVLKAHGVTVFGSCSCCDGTHVKLGDVEYQRLSLEPETNRVSMEDPTGERDDDYNYPEVSVML